MKRKTGFYWCNCGTLRGWLVCYFNGKSWRVPITNDTVKQQGEMEYFEQIDETRLIHKK